MVEQQDAAILESLARRGIHEVFHFIGLPHLPNLFRREGLCCAQDLRELGDEFDDDAGKWGWESKAETYAPFICCSVNSPMGMMTPDRRPVILALRAAVAAMPGVIFIGKWSSWGDVDAEASLIQTGVEWFDKMFLADDRYRAKPHPGEFLVPKHIPLAEVDRLIFHSQDDLSEARTLVRDSGVPVTGSLKVEVNATIFGRGMQEQG